MKKYKLKTIKDIFDKIPADRLDAFFAEIRELMAQSHAVRSAEGIGYVQFPKSITWVDDGKGEVEVIVHSLDKDEFVGSMKTTVRQK